ncbi:mast cell-expressed membrane protein 1 isoform X3 [Sapajus apella]|uniref:Mast cell-expressed membrane protein 1 isoform X3 n=1 Tax=Sapajus apella TaxID=9515 RepID=A0A6J3FQ31_SAPAP|nr:mast cell-expressed membrane protein 1 isoform X3 [Sapajus apella]
MQAPAFKEKKRGVPTKNQGAHDPDYENIILAFKNQDQAKGGHSRPTSQGEQTPTCSHPITPWEGTVPSQCRPPSDSIQIPCWLYRAILSVYALLALVFILCIVLSVFILVKNSEMSKELVDLKRDLWNDIKNIETKVQRILEVLEKTSKSSSK